MLALTDKVLLRFETELAALNDPSDEEIFDVITSLVLALNKVNDQCGAYDTDEREQLCGYIEDSLTEVGVDVEALAARRGLKRYEITDE